MPLVPTPRLALAALLASLAVLLLPGGGWMPLLVVDGLLLGRGASVDAALGAVTPAGCRSTRTLPPAVTLGAEAQVSWAVRNPGRQPVRLALADELAPSLRATTRRASRGGCRRAARCGPAPRCGPARRGRFTPTALVLRVDGPLGLASPPGDTLDVPGSLRVYPSFRSKDEAELRIRKARILEVGLRSAQGRGGGTEFDQLRDYSVDDEFRRMDWAATARAGRPIVRTYRAERNQTVLVLLDNGRTMAGRVDGVPRVEHAMDAVMMLTAVATGLGDRCGVVAFDREVRAVVPPASSTVAAEPGGRGALRPRTGAVRERLHRGVRRDAGPVPPPGAARGAHRPGAPRWRSGWCRPCPWWCGTTSWWWRPCGTPTSPAGRRPPAEDAPATYRRVAAVAALEERRRTVARLRGLGATVVDAAPGRLAPALADTYLQLKATGRL